MRLKCLFTAYFKLLASEKSVVELTYLLYMVYAPIILAALVGKPVLVLVRRLNGAVEIIDHGIVISEDNLSLLAKQTNLYGLVTAVVVHTVEAVFYTVLKGYKTFCAIFHINRLVTSVCHRTRHGIDLAINNPSDKVDGVYSLIYNHTAALLVPSALPIARLIIIIGARPSERGACGNNPSELSAFHGVSHKLRRVVVSALEDYTEGDAR